MHGINKRSHVCNDNIMVIDIGMYLDVHRYIGENLSIDGLN